MTNFDKNTVWNGQNFIINADAVNTFNNWYSATAVDTRYKHDEEILTEFVPKLVRSDASFNEIYHIVTLINSFYSTRMGGDNCYKLAEILHKQNKNILSAVKTGDEKTVQNIVNIEQEKLDNVPFSFTTKYFSILSRYLHNDDKFPIYDSVVATMLDFYFHHNGIKNKYYVSSMHKDYISYYNCITNLIDNSKTQYKKLDTYLWWMGRQVIDNIDQSNPNNPKYFRASYASQSVNEILDKIFTKIK